MTLSDLSIKNPVFAWMLMVGLIVFGWVSFQRMGISQLPDVDFPVVNVSITWEGAAPEVMETEVTDVLEDEVMSIEGIKEVSSTSRQGHANITIEFELNRDIDVALQEVQTRISQAQSDLPPEIDPPVVTKTNPEDHPIMWVALSAQTGKAGSSLESGGDTALPPDTPPSENRNITLRDLMAYTHDFMKNQFTTVSGVGEVILGGYIDPNLRVWLDAERMDALELTVKDVIAAIQSQHEEVPAGTIDTGKRELNVRVMGEAANVRDFERIIIPSRSGSAIWKTIRIVEVARIEEGLDDVRRISRHQGKPSVGLGIKKQRGANAVAVARGVKSKIAEIQKSLPEGMKLNVVFDSTRYIEESTRELTFTLILSALLTGLVCWLFLGSWSSTLNVLLAIPTSIIGAFTLLYFLGFTLNTFTLLGLSLAIGIVVDDAIMVLENIVRHREKGMTRVRAALVGAREITFAAMAASVAILAIFVPVVFMKGIIGKFFYQFGVTMTVAVMLSLLEALTLAPMRCSQYLQPASVNWVARTMDAWMTRAAGLYRRSLNILLDHRWTVVLIAAGLFASSLLLTRFLRKEFVPAQDEGRFLIRIQTPIGSSLGATNEVIQKAETFLMSRPDIRYYYAAVGGFGGGEVNTGMMFVTLPPRKERGVVAPNTRPLRQQEIMGVVREEMAKIPGAEKVIVQDLSQQGFSAQRGFPVEFTIRGPDWDQLATLSGTMRDKMRGTGLMTDIDTDYDLGMPEVRVVPDREKAGERGVSIEAIGETVSALIGGLRVGKYTQGGKRYDIRVRLVDEDRARADDIDKIWVRNNRGELIRLGEVATMSERPTLQSITRRNREREVGVFSNVAAGKSQAEALKAVEGIAKQALPDGYRIVLSGSAQTFRESFDSLLVALYLGIFVAYMVLASQFNSFIHPFTVLLALPFSVTGAFIALILGGQSLNIYSLIGLILLMGIVKKNSIMLVDFINRARLAKPDRTRESGRDTALAPIAPHLIKEAILEAAPLRLRPILMTAFSTVAAAVPPALGLGPGAEVRIPMALVVIGGVLVSTFLTLFVVPCAYSLLARFESHRHDQDLQAALKELEEMS